jgi:alkylation response protein AidB-like acyl-CoA dehydrogenase
MATLTTARGGAWLIEDTPATASFTPEQFSDEHRLIGQTADEFMTNEVLPAVERLEQKDWDLARRLVGRAGELGLLGTDVPELGGVGLDKIASTLEM